MPMLVVTHRSHPPLKHFLKNIALSFLPVLTFFLSAGSGWGAGAPYVIIWDWNTSGHAEYCQQNAMDTSGLDLDHVPIVPSRPDIYLTPADAPIVSFSYSCGASDSAARTLSYSRTVVSQACLEESKTAFLTSAPVAVASSAIDDGRWAPNIELVTASETDSGAIARVAGEFAYVWNQNPSWTRYQVRAAMRQTASNYPNWATGSGFGVPNKTAAAAVTTFDLHGPYGMTLRHSPSANAIYVDWMNFITPDFGKTVIVKFPMEPTEDSTPDSPGATILYSGEDVKYTYTVTQDEIVWFAFYSQNTAGTHYSKLYPIQKVQVHVDYSRAPTNVFFDNSVARSVQDGLSWETAYNSLGTANFLVNGDTLYFKDTGVPYQVPQNYTAMRYYHLIGGAIGIETTVNKGSKSILTNAISSDTLTWTVHSGNTYKATLEFGGNYQEGVSFGRNLYRINSDGSIAYLIKGADRDSLTAEQWYYGDESSFPAESPVVIYANWGPSGIPKETSWILNYVGPNGYNSSVYLQDGGGLAPQSVENLSFIFGYYGLNLNYRSPEVGAHTSHSFTNCDFSYNAKAGFYLFDYLSRDSDRWSVRWENCSFRNNESDGFLMRGYSGWGRGTDQGGDFFMIDCVAAHNGGSGFYLRSADAGTNGAAYNFYFNHNTAAFNALKGVWIAQNASRTGDIAFFVDANLSYKNGEEDFYFEENAGVSIFRGDSISHEMESPSN
jgi:hypothetical protein